MVRIIGAILSIREMFREDVLILSASGTAAVCNLGFMADLETSTQSPGRMAVETKMVCLLNSLLLSNLEF